jgi:hypothetical protein
VRYRYNDRFFDDFGPYVQQMREFDVKFDPAPVLHSRLYCTNDWDAIVLGYKADPFGATFVVANTARNTAIIHGDDTLSFAGSGDSVSQALTVFGRPLIIEDAENVLVENTDQIRARGKIETELTEMWLQSKTMANDVANWIRNRFTYGNEDITVTVFGNPLIVPTDVVTVDYPEKGITGDFFVVSVSNSFDAGITTSLTLRRRV